MSVNGFNSAQRVPLGILAPGNTTTVAWILKNLNAAGTNNFFEAPGGPNSNRTIGTICIQALPGNSGVVYVVQNMRANQNAPAGSATATAADVVNYSNVVQILSAGQSWFDNSWMINNLDPYDLYVGMSVAADGAVGYLETR